MSSYYRHDLGDDVTLWLRLHDPSTGAPVTGASPTVTIERHRESQGGPLSDGWYWNGTIFVAAKIPLAMPEHKPVDNPGVYVYEFLQSGIGVPLVYLVRFDSATAPAVGFAVEEHIFEKFATVIIEAEPSI